MTFEKNDGKIKVGRDNKSDKKFEKFQREDRKQENTKRQNTVDC